MDGSRWDRTAPEADPRVKALSDACGEPGYAEHEPRRRVIRTMANQVRRKLIDAIHTHEAAVDALAQAERALGWASDEAKEVAAIYAAHSGNQEKADA